MLLLSAIRNLSRNKRRTLAVLLTVGIGVCSLFIQDGFNSGIMNQYRDNTIHARYGHGQVFTAGYRKQVFEKPWEHWIENYDALREASLKIPGVKQIFPRVSFAALLTNGRINVSGFGQGVDGIEEAKFFTTMNVVEGKILSDEPDGIVLGIGLARALGVKPGDRVTVLGQTIYGTINGVDLTLTGVFETGSKDFDDVVFRIPLAQAHTLLDTQRIESVAFGLKSVDDWDTVAQATEERFPNLEAVPFSILDKVYYQHSVDWLGAQFMVIQFIILTMVVLGIFNTVSTAILERKPEIGNLRANGESVVDVLKLLSLEGLVLGILGAALGLVLALAVVHLIIPQGIYMPPAPGITRRFWVQVELQPIMAMISFLLGVACAFLATTVAAWRVARMPIGEALRST